MALGKKQVSSMHRLGYATVAEVAEVLLIGVVNIYGKVKEGQLRASRIGRATYVALDSLDAYLQKCSPPPEILAAAARLRIEAKAGRLDR